MKKIIKYLLLFIICVLPIKVKAASGVIDIYTSNKNPTIGSTFTITVYCKSSTTSIASCEYMLNYDSNKVKFISAQDTVSCNGTYCLYLPQSKSSSKTFTFKAIATGNTSISAKGIGLYDIEEKVISATVSPTTINIQTNSSTSNPSKPNTTTPTYSTNNNLKELVVEGANLNKAFDKNTTEYEVNLDASIENITIKATAEDSKSSVKGTGNFPITYGDNKFEIIVTSEKGTTKKYIINVKVEDKTPITINISNNKYTVIKNLNVLTKLDNYNETKITINNQEIPAFYNENLDYTIIGIKDDNQNISYALYKDGTYKLYKELHLSSLAIAIDETKVFKNYQKFEITIGDNTYSAYKQDKKSNYSYFYGTNLENGKSSWYKYESDENTLQKYDIKELENLEKKLSDSKKLILTLTATSIFLVIVTIIASTIKIKPNKKKKQKEKI